LLRRPSSILCRESRNLDPPKLGVRETIAGVPDLEGDVMARPAWWAKPYSRKRRKNLRSELRLY
jgi:hypothetical protein